MVQGMQRAERKMEAYNNANSLKNTKWQDVLCVIYEHQFQNPLCLAKLEKVMKISHDTCTTVVYTLEDRNLIERKTKNSQKMIYLTNEGKKMAELIQQIKMLEMR